MSGQVLIISIKNDKISRKGSFILTENKQIKNYETI